MTPQPPLISRCRRFGILSLSEDEFKPGRGGKGYVHWSDGHGACAFHERSKEYVRLVEGSQLNELGASVDEITEQLRRLIVSVENHTVEAIDCFDSQLAESNLEFEAKLGVAEAASERAVARLEARVKALESGASDRGQSLEEQSLDVDERISSIDRLMTKMNELMLDRFASADERIDEMQRKSDLYNQHLSDLSTLLGGAAERISGFDSALESHDTHIHSLSERLAALQSSDESLLAVQTKVREIDTKINAIEQAEEKRLVLATTMDGKLAALRHEIDSKVDNVYADQLSKTCEDNRQQVAALQQAVQLAMADVAKCKKTVEAVNQRTGEGQSVRPPEWKHKDAENCPKPSLLGSYGGKKKTWDTDPSTDPLLTRPMRSHTSLPDIHGGPRGGGSPSLRM